MCLVFHCLGKKNGKTIKVFDSMRPFGLPGPHKPGFRQDSKPTTFTLCVRLREKFNRIVSSTFLKFCLIKRLPRYLTYNA